MNFLLQLLVAFLQGLFALAAFLYVVMLSVWIIRVIRRYMGCPDEDDISDSR